LQQYLMSLDPSSITTSRQSHPTKLLSSSASSGALPARAQ
jgi:hypothetical protein